MLGWAVAKAAFAFALVFLVGRWFLRPLFHLVAARQSFEMFTLAVLLVALLAAWTTNSLGLSLAFGGFLAGMILGETEFRHQVESSISPFRDVLLGLFFVGIGMRFDPAAVPPIWLWAVLGALLILTSKTLLVAAMVRTSGVHVRTAWRTGLMLSIGGEFGLALVAIAMDSGVIDVNLGQIAITSVLLSMVVGAVLIHFNGVIADRLVGPARDDATSTPELPESVERQVLLGGYGRVGHAVAVLLQSSKITFVAFDIDPNRVAQGRADGHTVWFGDISSPVLLSSVHVERASLVVITIDNSEAALATMSYLRRTCPQVPVVVRAPDLEASNRLLEAGAAHAYPETIEASLHLGAAALQMLDVTSEEIDRVLQDVRDWDYRPVLEPDDNRQ
jgi:CPA2 family monovalent cation:H+ antiporter-2